MNLLWQWLGASPEMGTPPSKALFKTEQGKMTHSGFCWMEIKQM